jgi:hypothetical protein
MSFPINTSNSATKNPVNSPTHGFVVGDWVYLNGAAYAKTDSDLAISAESVGIVSAVNDADNFIITTEGYVTGLSGLTAGSRYYLSATPGTITVTAPTSNVKAVFIANSTTSGYVQQYAVGASSIALTYGRVNAAANLSGKTYVSTGFGSTVDFTATVYSSGMSFSGTNSIIPSISGRYKADYYLNAGSDETANNATVHIVQGGVSLGSVYINQHNSAGSVNQTSGFIDVDLVAGTPVFLHYQPEGSNEAVVFDKGTHFQLSQLPTAIAPVVDTIAEYGESNLASNYVLTAAFANAGLSVNLPSAGTYRLSYNVTEAVTHNTDTVRISYARLFDTTLNLAVANSTSTIGGIDNEANVTTNNFFGSSFQTFYTVTGPTTINLQAYISGTTSGTSELRAAGVDTGGTKLSFEKIAGQLSATGQTVDYIQAGLSSDTTQTYGSGGTRDIIFNTIASGNIPLNTTTGAFSLTAGKTYEIESQISVSNVTGHITFSWVDAVTNTQIITSPNFQNQIFSVDSGFSYSSSPVNKILYTPSVDQTIKLRVDADLTSTLNTFSIQANRGTYAVIKQLGTTAITSNDVGGPIKINNTTTRTEGLYQIAMVRWTGDFEFFQDQYLRFAHTAGNFQIAAVTSNKSISVYGFNDSGAAVSNSFPIGTDATFVGKSGYNNIAVGVFQQISDVAITSDYDDIQLFWIQVSGANVKYRVTIMGGGLAATVERWDYTTIVNNTKITFPN